MGLRFDPIGGGQFKTAVKQIVEAERQPIKQIEERKAKEQARLKLFQDFKNKFQNFDKTLTEFANFKKFRELKVDLGEGANFVSVTLDKEKAEPGVYTLQVDQLAKPTSVISNGFNDPDEPTLGVGFVVMALNNGESKEVYVDSNKSSLHGIANMINTQSDSPVQASVIRDSASSDKQWKLIMTGKKNGTDDKVDFPEVYFLDGQDDFYFDDKNQAQNANVQIDGFPVELESNEIKDFLNGINLHLKQASPDKPITISVTEDTAKISGKVKGLVDQVNGVLEFINGQNKVDDKSDTRSSFAGDTSLQTIEYRLRNLMHEGFAVYNDKTEKMKFVFGNEFGLEFDKKGTLEFKEDKFNKALEKNFTEVAEAITGEFGMARQLKDVISGYTRQPDGIINLRETSLKNRIKKYDEDIAQKERRVEQKQQALTEQFSRLEASLSNLQRQSQYLSATLGGGGGGGGLVQQLLGG